MNASAEMVKILVYQLWDENRDEVMAQWKSKWPEDLLDFDDLEPVIKGAFSMGAMLVVREFAKHTVEQQKET